MVTNSTLHRPRAGGKPVGGGAQRSTIMRCLARLGTIAGFGLNLANLRDNVLVAAASCSTVTVAASLSPAEVDVAGSSGCDVTVTWAASASENLVEDVSREILDVFIVLDESGSVNGINYDKMFAFVKSFAEDLDNSAQLFEAGGKIGITGFSWNPTDMIEYTSQGACFADHGFYNCFQPMYCSDSTSDSGNIVSVCTKYYIPNDKYAEPNSYHIFSTLADTLAAVDAECYKPTCHGTFLDDCEWAAYGYTDLGDAIMYTTQAAQAAFNDASRPAPPDRQVMLVVTGEEHNRGYFEPLEALDMARSYGIDVRAIGVGDVVDSQQADIGGPAIGEDSDAYVFDLEDFADLDDSCISQILGLIVTPCATNAELTVTMADAAGGPTTVTCGQRGETCDARGSNFTWTISEFDATERTASYDVGVCDCDNVGTLDTLAGVSYTDDNSSTDAYPVLPSSIQVQVTDNTGYCGTPGVGLDAGGVWTDGVSQDALANVGEAITFTYSIINTGSTTLQNFCLIDANLGDGCLECSTSATGTVVQGGKFSCAFTYEINQADVDRGAVDCSAQVTAQSIAGDEVSAAAAASIYLPPKAWMGIVETGVWVDLDSSTFPDKGEVVDYTIVVSNKGTVTLQNIQLTDTSGVVTCENTTSSISLGIGETYTCAASRQLTQANINAGSVSNTATAYATAGSGDRLTNSSTCKEALEWSPQIEVVIEGKWEDGQDNGVANYADKSEIISYDIKVSNIGNVDLTTVSVSDTAASNDCSVVAELGVGDSAACTGNYSLTWDDIRAGAVVNTATASAYDRGLTRAAISSFSDETRLRSPPSIALVMDGVFMDDSLSQDNLATAGETIQYNLTATNGGHATLYNVIVSDPSLTSGERAESTLQCNVDFAVSGHRVMLDDPLIVDDWVTCAAVHVVTSDDVDNLKRDSTATVYAEDIYGYEVSVSDAEVVVLDQVGSVWLTMTPTYAKETAASTHDEVHYTYTITNNGLLSLYNIELVVDGLVENGMALSCDDVGGESVEGESAGKVTGLAAYPDNGLSPAASLTCNATDNVSQVEIGVGVKTDAATAKASHESNADQLGDERVIDDDDSSVDLNQDPEIWVTHTARYSPADEANGLAAVGKSIQFEVMSTNTGNVEIANATLSNEMFKTDDGGYAIGCSEGIPDPWLVGTSFTCSAVYTISQDDIDAGSVSSTARVSGDLRSGEIITNSSTATQGLSRTADLTVSMSAVVADSDATSGDSAGDTIEYTIELGNNGTTTLSNISASSALFLAQLPSDAAVMCEARLDGLQLAPADTIRCSAVYEVQQADVDAGGVNNSVVAGATSPLGDVPDDATVWQELDSLSTVQIVSTATVDTGTHAVASAEDGVAMAHTVTSTGNTCLRDAVVSDLSIGELECSADLTGDDQFCPLDGHIFTRSEVEYISQEHVDAGKVVHESTVSANSVCSEEVVGDSSSLHTPLVEEYVVSIGKTAVYSSEAGNYSASAVGDFIAYTICIISNGSQTLWSVIPADSKVEDLSCEPDFLPETGLSPGDTALCSGSYYITQADIDANKVMSVANVTATSSSGDTAFSQTRHTQQLVQAPAISIMEIGEFADEDGDGFSDAGETMGYTITVQNVGNVRLKNVTVVNSLEHGTLTCGDGFEAAITTNGSTELLSPSEEFKCTATYTMTQEGVDSGEVVNVVVISGIAQDAVATQVEGTDSWEEELLQDASIVLALSDTFVDGGVVDGQADTDDSMKYAFSVQNIGSGTLSEIDVTATVLGDDPQSSLLPSESMVCATNYTITSADIDSYQVATTVLTTAVGPRGQNPSDVGELFQSLDAWPSLSLTKVGKHMDRRYDGKYSTLAGNGLADAGEYTSYTITITNTGMMGMHKIDVTEMLEGAQVVCETHHLSLGHSMVCNATYPLTQVDLDWGGVTNVAAVVGYGPVGTNGEKRSMTETQDTTWVDLPQHASIQMDQVCTWQDGSEADGLPDPDEFMLLTYTVSNNGSVTLFYGTIREGDDGGEVVDCSSLPDNANSTTSLESMSPNEEVTCKSFNFITQADIDSGTAAKAAKVTAMSPLQVSTEGLAACSWEWGSIPPDIDTTAYGVFVDKNGDSLAQVGETVLHNVTVVNTGKVTAAVLYAMATTKSLSSTYTATVECDPPISSAPSLAPGKALYCTAEYPIGRDDVNLGKCTTEVDVTATGPDATEATSTDSHSQDLLSKYDVLLTFEGGDAASSDVDGDGRSSDGDTLTFTLNVTNTGSVDLKDAEVQAAALDRLICRQFDPSGQRWLLDWRRLLGWATETTHLDTLPSGKTYICTGSYTLNQDDVDAGELHITASVTAHAKDDEETFVAADAEETLTLEPYPSLVVEKADRVMDTDVDSLAEAGEPTGYELVVTNTGSVRMSTVTVMNAMLPDVDCSYQPQRLDTEASVSCSIMYNLVQEDVGQGMVTNQMGVADQDPSSENHSAMDSDDVSLSRKVDSVHNVFEVTDLGTVTTKDINILDYVLPGSLVCPVGTLQPGASMACIASEPYIITAEDLSMGSAVNTATATGDGPLDDDKNVTVTDSVTAYTPSRAGNPVLLTYTSVSTLPTALRPRLDDTENACGWEAIVAACNKAFGVDTCQCVNHSDGGCEVAPVEETAEETTVTATSSATATGSSFMHQADEEKVSTTISSSTTVDSRSGSATVSATASTLEGDAEGRVLQDTSSQQVTTTLEIPFVTDVHSTGALKASAAQDSFANIEFGFAELLIGDCFEDVTITSVSVSPTSAPPSRPVANDDTSSTSHSDHIVPPTETVPPAVDLSFGGTEQSMWIVIFIICLLLSMCICTSGVKCIRATATTAAKWGVLVGSVAYSIVAKGADNARTPAPANYCHAGGERPVNWRVVTPGSYAERSLKAKLGWAGLPPYLRWCVHSVVDTIALYHPQIMGEGYVSYRAAVERSSSGSSDFEWSTFDQRRQVSIGRWKFVEAIPYTPGAPDSWQPTANPRFNRRHVPRLSALDSGTNDEKNENEPERNPAFRRRQRVNNSD